MTRIFVTLFSFVLALSSMAQDFNIKGEFRFRPEFREGYKHLRDSNTTPAYFIAQRSRLQLNFEEQKVSTSIVLQETRTWGDELMKSSKATLGVYQAWVKWNFADSMFLKLGRQEFIFDNERLLSNNNWSSTGQSFDAALFNYKNKNKKLNIAISWNQQGEKTNGIQYNNSTGDILNNPISLSFVHYEQKIGKTSVSILNITDAFMSQTSSTIYARNTGGFGICADLNKFGFKSFLFTQNGTSQAGDKINAYYANIEFFYKFKKHKATIGSELMSGNDNKKIYSTTEQFIPLYGSNHAFNGYSDFFTNMSTSTDGAGLMDSYIKWVIQINEKSKFMADIHYFRIPNKTYAYGKLNDLSLAGEIDLTFQKKVTNIIDLSLGYSLFKANKFLGTVQGGDYHKWSHWAYASLTFKPNFFSKK